MKLENHEQKELSENLEKYYSIMNRYHNGAFGDSHLTLREILDKAGESDLLDKMSIEEIQVLVNQSTGLTKMMFTLLQNQKMESKTTSSLGPILSKKINQQ